MVEDKKKNEVVLLIPDAAKRAQVQALLEQDGYSVQVANDQVQLRDVLRASRALAVVVQPRARSVPVERLEADLERNHPEVDVLVPDGFGHALLEGALGRRRVAHFALDSLFLLAGLVERASGQAPRAESTAQMAELAAQRLGLARSRVEAVAAAAVLACLGGSLVKFRFGEGATGGAEAGLSPELAAAVAAASSLRAPYDLGRILAAVEERWDGRGRPRGLVGTQIPIEARIVAVARDATRSTGQLSAALQAIGARAGTDYDPRVVSAFSRAVRDSEYVARLQTSLGAIRVVVADPDPTALAVAELELGAAGFAVRSFLDGRAALDAILADPPDAVVCETVLPRFDGLSLLIRLRREPRTVGLPIFLTGQPSGPTVAKGLKLGATDFLAKPVHHDVLAVKLREAVRKATPTPAAEPANAGKSGVYGTLDEVSLTDLLQVVSFGRKTATIHIESARGQGTICLERGEPVAAFTAALAGLEAFVEVASWQHGRFKMESGGDARERNLSGNLEALLLEALRRQDEARTAVVRKG